MWRKEGDAYSPQNNIPNSKFADGDIVVWGCFSANGASNIQIIEDRMNAEDHQDISNSNLQEFVAKLELR